MATVSGIVLDTNGNAVPFARIEVFKADGVTRATTFSLIYPGQPVSDILLADITGSYAVSTSDVSNVVRASASGYLFIDGTDAIAPSCVLDPFTEPTAPSTLVISKNTTWNTAVNIPANQKVFIAAGVTLTINGSLTAGLYDIFTGPGTVVFGVIAEVYPEWWGGGSGVADSRPAIQAATDSLQVAGGKVKFSNTTYILGTANPVQLISAVNSMVQMRSNVTYEGLGESSEIKLKDGFVTGNSTILVPYTLLSGFYGSPPVQMHNIAIRNLKINLNGANNPSGAGYILQNAYRRGVDFGLTSDALVDNVHFTDMNVGNAIVEGWVNQSTISGFKVTKCTFDEPTSGDTNNPDHSTIWTSAFNSIITDNIFRNTNAQGKVKATTCEFHESNGIFSGNTMIGYRQGLYIGAGVGSAGGMDHIVVTGNTAKDLYERFATVESSGTNTVSNVNISSNVMNILANPLGASTYGVLLISGDGLYTDHLTNITISNNVATMQGTPSHYFVFGFTNSDDVHVHGNLINGSSGIVFSSTGGNTLTYGQLFVTDNVCIECGPPSGAIVSAAAASVAGFTAKNNTFFNSATQTYGVLTVITSSFTEAVVENNNFLGNVPTNELVFSGVQPTKITAGKYLQSFTPIIVGLTTAGAGTYTTQTGLFTVKEGKVYFEIVLVWTAHTGTGGMSIQGLPLVPATHMPVSIMYDSVAVGTGKQLTGYTNTGAPAAIYLFASDVAGGAANLLAMDPAGSLYIAGWYRY